ncbi:MAG: thiol protease [Porphyromonadaceae bacterium]|nr:thiol protease [Porphyromonadaceae bacterium]
MVTHLRYIISFTLCTLIGSGLWAQIQRPIYPIPTITPEVQAEIEARHIWEPHIVRSSEELPKGVDNSLSKYFPPIFDQIGNSCSQASSIGYVFTYEMNRLLDRDASREENTFSYFYTWNFLNEGSGEGSFPVSGFSMTHINGAMSRTDFPDQLSSYCYYWESGYDKYIEAMHYRTKETVSIPLETQSDIILAKQYLAEGGCFTYSSYSSNWVINNHYTGPSVTGYKSLLTSLATEGAHALTIVGYDDLIEFIPANGDSIFYGAFIVVNSWGNTSHDKGRFYLPYSFFLQKREENYLSTSGTGAIVEYHEPKIVFKIKVTYSSRDDLSFILGVADKPYTESPTLSYTNNTMNSQGGNHPMPGSKTYVSEPYSLEFAFDFTDQLDKFETYTEPKYFLDIIRRETGEVGSGTIDYFSVIDYRKNPVQEYVCTSIDHTTLISGNNLFSIPTTKTRTVSASPISWIKNGSPSEQTHIVRTALGHYVKLDFINYNSETGELSIHYLYQPEGKNLSTY